MLSSRDSVPTFSTMRSLRPAYRWYQSNGSSSLEQRSSQYYSFPYRLIMKKEQKENLLLNPGKLLGRDDQFLLEALEEDLLLLRSKLLCKRGQFFGAHPVSLTMAMKKSIDRDPFQYLVCQKSDGVRFILIVLTDGKCLMTSRKAQKGGQRMQFFEVNIQLRVPQLLEARQFKLIYQVFDGQLLFDAKNMVFLIFDTIVHRSNAVHEMLYSERLHNASLFIRMVQMYTGLLGTDSSHTSQTSISIKLKDFFTADRSHFILQYYIKKLKHGNDGLIFTKIKWKYRAGTCPQLLKWKPPHLNSVDFMTVFNLTLTAELDQPSLFVYDLYVKTKKKNEGVDQYVNVFFDFMVVNEEDHQLIKTQLFVTQQGNHTILQGIVCECCLQSSRNQEARQFLKSVYQAENPEDLLSRTELASSSVADQDQINLVKNLIKSSGQQCWRINKIRADKSNPNNLMVALNILQTVKENIRQQDFRPR